jgi:hypothetical protein
MRTVIPPVSLPEPATSPDWLEVESVAPWIGSPGRGPEICHALEGAHRTGL